MHGMTGPDPDPLAEAQRALGAAQRAEAKAKLKLTQAKATHSSTVATTRERRTDRDKRIADEVRSGRRQADIAALTKLTPERIRQICRAHGVEPPK